MEVVTIQEVSEESALDHISRFLQDENMMALVNPDVTAQLQRVQEAMKKRGVMLRPEDLDEDDGSTIVPEAAPTTPKKHTTQKADATPEKKAKSSKKEKRKSGSGKRKLMEED